MPQSMTGVLTALAALGFLGGLFDPGDRNLEATLVWAAMWAAPAGALSALDGRRGWLALVGLALAWILVSPRTGPLGGAVLLGLFLFGRGAAQVSGRRERSVTPALVLLLAAFLLVALPVRGGLGRRPWSPHVAARTLDLSPATWVVEAAGIDWLRRPSVYERAGGDAIGPSLRAPYDPMLAGVAALVVGLVALGLGQRVGPRT